MLRVRATAYMLRNPRLVVPASCSHHAHQLAKVGCAGALTGTRTLAIMREFVSSDLIFFVVRPLLVAAHSPALQQRVTATGARLLT